MRSLPVIFTSLLLWLLSACGPAANDYSNFVALDNGSWAYDDTLAFDPQLTDSVADGELCVAVCHNNSYEWSNLWLEVSYPEGAGFHRDTVELVLADDFGHWKGKGFGTSFQLEKRLVTRIRMHRGTRIYVRHIMRVDTLRDIEQVGVTFAAR